MHQENTNTTGTASETLTLLIVAQTVWRKYISDLEYPLPEPRKNQPKNFFYTAFPELY